VRLPGEEDAREYVLRVGEASPGLDAWLSRRRVASWAVLTAWNPQSRHSSRAANLRAQSRLRAMLRRAGFGKWYRGENLADRADWPPEATFFVPALTPGQASAFARAFRQNAFLWGRRGEAARLAAAALLWFRK
jgi:hypothetical protein